VADEGFKITDRRAGARAASAPSPSSSLVLGQSVASAKAVAALGSRGASAALSAGRQGVIPTDASESRRMQVQRAGSRLGSVGIGGGSNTSINFATQRPQDPFFYWQQNNLPYDFDDPRHMILLRQLCRHIYKAHSVMASAIDIYSYWPLLGMEFECKDKAITEFHNSLFFDQLDYEEFLPSLLHEYWTVGEAFPLGSFNETLGVWEADELLNPDDVFVERSPFIKEPNLYIRLPESLRRVLTTGQPPEQYNSLMRSYPELRAYAQENARMPVSNILLKHLKFKGDNFAPRGLPIMYRALRPLMQEEMMNAAQDAIADRLYTPLVLAKVGASATDLGTEEPWIPTTEQIANFEMALDAALAADFRVLTTHFAVDMESVFGRESMPNFDQDFERLTEKQLQAFGMSKTMLSGAGGGETYAADAMNRDLVSQLLGRAQRYVRRFVQDRATVVAEAQGHYDYEVRGGKRYPIMEEILEVDEESGEQRIVEQPKLLVPELKLKSMNLKDEQVEREFLESMRDRGVPISAKRRFQSVDIDLDAEREAVAEEQIEEAVEAQKVRQRTYMRLKAERLPIPADLKTDFEPRAKEPGGAAAQTDAEAEAAAPVRVPMLGVDGQDTSALAPTPEVLATPPGEPLGVPAGPGGTIAPQEGAQVIPIARNTMIPPSRPPESDEMRKDMPKAGSFRIAHEVIAEHVPPAPVLVNEFDQSPMWHIDETTGMHQPWRAKEGGIIQGPRHVGLRRYAGVTKDSVLGYEPDYVEDEEATS
jgi:hypothetical protein